MVGTRGTLSKKRRCSGVFCLQVLWNILLSEGKTLPAAKLEAKEDNPLQIKIPTGKGRYFYLVGTRGFEPPTSCTPCKRSTRLNYVPKIFIIIFFIGARSLPPSCLARRLCLRLEVNRQLAAVTRFVTFVDANCRLPTK